MFTGPPLEVTDVPISPCLGIRGRGGGGGYTDSVQDKKTPWLCRNGHWPILCLLQAPPPDISPNQVIGVGLRQADELVCTSSDALGHEWWWWNWRMIPAAPHTAFRAPHVIASICVCSLCALWSRCLLFRNTVFNRFKRKEIKYNILYFDHLMRKCRFVFFPPTL